MAHHDELRAKQHYVRLRSMYDNMPGVENQHRVTVEFFTGQIRKELDRWVDSDDPLTDYPFAHMLVSRWRFVPVVERSVEAGHSLVKRGAGYRSVSAPYVSLIVR